MHLYISILSYHILSYPIYHTYIYMPSFLVRSATEIPKKAIAIAAIGEALSPWYPHFRRKSLFGTQWLDQIFVPFDPLCISVLFRQIPMFDANGQTCKSLNLLKSNMFVA